MPKDSIVSIEEMAAFTDLDLHGDKSCGVPPQYYHLGEVLRELCRRVIALEKKAETKSPKGSLLRVCDSCGTVRDISEMWQDLDGWHCRGCGRVQQEVEEPTNVFLGAVLRRSRCAYSSEYPDAYFIHHLCRNCGEALVLAIPRGIPVGLFVAERVKQKDMPCPVCGCPSLDGNGVRQ